MPRAWLSFGLVCLPFSFSLPFFDGPLWHLLYTSYILSFLVNILLFIDKKKIIGKTITSE